MYNTNVIKCIFDNDSLRWKKIWVWEACQQMARQFAYQNGDILLCDLCKRLVAPSDIRICNNIDSFSCIHYNVL